MREAPPTGPEVPDYLTEQQHQQWQRLVAATADLNEENASSTLALADFLFQYFTTELVEVEKELASVPELISGMPNITKARLERARNLMHQGIEESQILTENCKLIGG